MSKKSIYDGVKNLFLLIYIGVIAVFSPSSSVHADTESLVRFYGFVLPTTIYSTRGVESYSRPNATAVTGAGNPVLSYQPEDTRFTFQLAQSRIGLTIAEKKKLSGRFEFDFIDFTKPSATTTMVPRVRRAYAQYALTDTDIIVVGQEWDIFSPLGPHTYNLVGRFFEAGDTGFMRNQVFWARTTPSYEAALSVGLQGSNPSGTSGNAADTNLELSKRPTLAARAGVMLPDQGRVGLSAIATQILVDPTNYSRITAYGANAYAEVNLFDKFLNLRSELYVGRNLCNLGALSLAFGNAYYDTAEAGGWVSGKIKATESVGMFAGFGLAQVLSPEAMPYAYNGTGATSVLGSTGPGIERNYQAKIGADYKPEPNFTLFTEVTYLNTRHHLRPADAVVYDPQRTAVVTQAGLMFEI